VEPIPARSFAIKGHAVAVSKLCLKRLAVPVAELFSNRLSLVELDHLHVTLTVLVAKPVAIPKSNTSATMTPNHVPNALSWLRSRVFVARRL
jgi:hypothetical protein